MASAGLMSVEPKGFFSGLSRMLVLVAAMLAAVSTTAGNLDDPNPGHYGLAVLQQSDEAALRNTVRALLARLAHSDEKGWQSTRERIPRELLLVEDLVRPILREWTGKTNAVSAAELLWFLGDKEEITALETKPGSLARPTALLPPGLACPDLGQLLKTMRTELHLADHEFRTEALFCNRQLTKAYVRLVLGPSVAAESRWGIMLHHREEGWQLIWSRPEASSPPAMMPGADDGRSTLKPPHPAMVDFR